MVFITPTEKRTVMCLYGVTGRSGHVDRTLQSVHPELQWLSVDRTLADVWLALTGRVRSCFPLTGTLLMSTGRWTSRVWSLAEQRPVSSRNLISVWSALTGRVRSGFSLFRTLLESTGHWSLASGDLTSQCPVTSRRYHLGQMN